MAPPSPRPSPGCGAGGPAPHRDPLSCLPSQLLDAVLGLLLLNDRVSTCSLRASCTWLRDAVDALNTRLSLGGPERPHDHCLDSSEQAAWQLEEEPAPGMRMRLLALVHGGPCLTSMAIRPQLRWLSWTDAMTGGGLPLCQRLTSLCLRGRQDVTHLRPLAACSALTHLDLSNCDALRDLRPLAACGALQHLQLNNCQGLDYLGPLAALSPALRQLELNGCRGVTDLPIMTRLTSVSHLGLSECSGISDLHFLPSLAALAHLNVRDCPDVTDLQPLAGCPALRHLNLHHCRGVTNLYPLAFCAALTHLDCGLCSGVQDLQPLAACAALQYLDVGNARVESLAPLSACAGLRHLQLNGCMYVHDLTPLAACTALRHVDIRACGKIKDFSPLDAVRRVLRTEPVSAPLSCGSSIMNSSSLSGAPARHRSRDSTCKRQVGRAEQLMRGSRLPQLGAQGASCSSPKEARLARKKCLRQHSWCQALADAASGFGEGYLGGESDA